MSLTRREMLRAGMGVGITALLTGCGSATRSSRLPGVPWPDVAARPRADAAPVPSSPTIATEPGKVIARETWTKAAPITRRINPMGGIARITIHHEGSPNVVDFSDAETSAQRIEQIRRYHVGRGWADIGYHYVVDRGGRVWAGRPLRYQGAHVRDHNEHNIGVMCLGNFDIQSPSDAQLAGMVKIVRALRRKFRVEPGRIRTHQELVATSCPGRAMQPRVVSLRASNKFT